MKIYTVVFYKHNSYGIDDVTVVRAYQDELDAKVFCSYENDKLKSENEEYVYYESELY